MWTGDNPDHSIVKDPTISTNATVKISEFFDIYAPNATLYPIHGNHEFDPMNVQDFSLEIDPVINIVADSWKEWMTEDAYRQYKENTFYSMMASDHPDITPEFAKKMEKTRIIGYNSQNCYIYNFFTIGQHNDPMHQLEWLENLLRQMEEDGEVAIFIGHMSPGTSDCISEVSSRLRAIFDRFQHIIRLNLFGHTHREEYEVIRSVKDQKAIGVNFLAPSMTTLENQNPSFRVITLDAETKLPLRIETHTFDITEANKDDANAEFFFDHDLIQEYGLQDLRPQSFLELSHRFMDDEDLIIRYSVNMFAGGPGSPIGKG